MKKHVQLWIGLVLLISIYTFSTFTNEAVATNTKAADSDPLKDTEYLFSVMQELGISVEKGLWEATVFYPTTYTIEAFEQEVYALSSIFQFPASTGISYHQNHLQYVNKRQTSEDYQLSLRLLAISTSEDEYELQLIVKLESTSPDKNSYPKQLEQFVNNVRNTGQVPTFYTLLKGSTDDILTVVEKEVVQYLGTYENSEFVEAYVDKTSYSVRHLSEVNTQLLIHWNSVRERTEVTLGTPYIITEF